MFLNRRGGRLSTRGAYNALATIAEAAGIDVGRDAEFTPHVLRHTAGTTLTRAGTDIILVAEILGHSVETARRYALPTTKTATPPSPASPPTNRRPPAEPDGTS